MQHSDSTEVGIVRKQSAGTFVKYRKISALKLSLRAGRLGNGLLIPGRGKGIIFFSKVSGPILRQWVPLTVDQGLKRSQREAGYSSLCIAEVHQ